MKGSQLQWHSNGETLAYEAGLQAGDKCDLKSNPQFSTYSERIAYRTGWMTAMKAKSGGSALNDGLAVKL